MSKKNTSISNKDFQALLQSLNELDSTANKANLDKTNNTLTMNQRGAKEVVPRLRRALNVMLTVSKIAIGAAVVHYIVLKNPLVRRTLRALIDQVVRLVPGSAKVIASLLTKLARRIPGFAKVFSVYIPNSVVEEIKERERKKGSKLYYVALIAGGIAIAALGGVGVAAAINPARASFIPFGPSVMKGYAVLGKYSAKALAQLGAAKAAGKSLLTYGKPVVGAGGKIAGFVKGYGKAGWNLGKRAAAPVYKYGSKLSGAKGIYNAFRGTTGTSSSMKNSWNAFYRRMKKNI